MLARKAEGILFFREDIDRLWLTGESQEIVEKPRAASGRPPKYDWGDVYLELSRLLYVGSITENTKQSVLEDIIAEYLFKVNKHSPSESLIRSHAKTFILRVIKAE